MERKILSFEKHTVYIQEIMANFQGWNAYAKWANTIKLRRKIAKKYIKPKNK